MAKTTLFIKFGYVHTVWRKEVLDFSYECTGEWTWGANEGAGRRNITHL